MSKIIASHIDRWYGGEKQSVQPNNSNFELSSGKVYFSRDIGDANLQKSSSCYVFVKAYTLMYPLSVHLEYRDEFP